MPLRRIPVIVLTLLLTCALTYAGEKGGGIVLSFDDGHPSWIQIIAPELARVGGVATGFVNNQRIRFGDLTFADLRTLQNTYGWEIGTHTYHHFDAPAFVKQKGLSAWIRDELESSSTELRSEGLKVSSMVFPYNAFTRELSAEVMRRFKDFRRDDVYPMHDRINEDGSIPGTEIDIGFYVPITQVFKWIDFARQQDKLLFLYGHKVLADEEFFTGAVESLSMQTLVSKEPVKPFNDRELCLVPDVRRRLYSPVKVESVKGKIITIFRGDLSLMAEAGGTLIIGPCYGMQRSFFMRMIEYAAKQMPFYTVEQAVGRMQQSSK